MNATAPPAPSSQHSGSQDPGSQDPGSQDRSPHSVSAQRAPAQKEVAPAQRELVAALEAQLRAADGECQRVDTHMSHVFLTPSHAYKLKRAVVHPFADMSTLARREAACREELTINQRLAPRLYERVEPIVRTSAGTFEIGGEGTPVDVVVRMRRFADSALFSEMAATGVLTAAHVDEAVDRLIDLHRSQPADADRGGSDDWRNVLLGLRQTSMAGETRLPERIQRLFDELDRRLAGGASVLAARRARGWVRRGHGDFHLQNICVFEGAVTPFDALEFDPTLATTDVIYDVAFLLMDLQARGRAEDANRAMNRYWDRFDQDEAALGLLPFFMAMRAAVRMAVAREAGRPADADLYLTLAETLLSPPPARLVAIGGLSGAGKSSVARGVAPSLPGCNGARVLSADMLRKRNAGLRPEDRLEPSHYTPERREAVYADLTSRAGAALAAGTSVVADATFQNETARRRVEAAAGAHPFTGIWLDLDVTVRVERVSTRHNDVSDISPRDAARQAIQGHLGRWHIVDAGRPMDATIAVVKGLTDATN